MNIVYVLIALIISDMVNLLGVFSYISSLLLVIYSCVFLYYNYKKGLIYKLIPLYLFVLSVVRLSIIGNNNEYLTSDVL